LVLRREDSAALAEEFDRYGEVAVIDLDAAMGRGVPPYNLDMIRPLLRRAECRVGGGIRNADQAKELVSLGAKKIIAGSAVFRDPKKGALPAGDSFAVNIPFLESLAGKIGRQRIIAAVDAAACVNQGGGSSGYEIVVDGWKTRTGLDLVEAAKAVEPYVSELLFTCVDREGTMTGMDLKPVKLLRGAVSCRITAAGGVSSLDEVEALAALGCDVQLGMALYTGKVSLAAAFAASLNWKKGAAAPTDGAAPAGALLPLIVQSPEGQVLMTGFADREAVLETFTRGRVCFHSRGRDRLWMKGETSGNTLVLKKLRADCDRDAVLAVAEPSGPVCHTGDFSCFSVERRYTWETLRSIIAERLRNPAPGSYTASLDDELVREKVQEEAGELCAAVTHEEVVWEAADLLYFATVLMTRKGVTTGEILDELDRRHKK
jgi:phosphoribosyl-ATP pyrophosphohydrolase/phosphoribosyl-AMP cyclohydrolase